MVRGTRGPATSVRAVAGTIFAAALLMGMLAGPAQGHATATPKQAKTHMNHSVADYKPKSGFVGVDTFVYVANDEVVDSAPAEVTVDVAADQAPTAYPKSIATDEDRSVGITVTG